MDQIRLRSFPFTPFAIYLSVIFFPQLVQQT